MLGSDISGGPTIRHSDQTAFDVLGEVLALGCPSSTIDCITTATSPSRFADLPDLEAMVRLAVEVANLQPFPVDEPLVDLLERLSARDLF